MTYVLDTNVFLRVLVRENEADFSTCSKLFKKIKELEVEAVVPGVVLAELGWVLGSYYRLGREKVAEKITGVIRTGGLRIVDDYDWLKAMEIYRKRNVKLVDSILGTMPRVAAGEWVIVSYDRDFDKLGVRRREPGEI